MNIISIIILGLVQGITEFLPVSSSGHVLIASKLLHNPTSFEFDVLVSFGTLLAIIIYYRHRLAQIIKRVFTEGDIAFVVKLVVATIPAVAVGFLFQDFIETHLHNTVVVIIMLAVIGVLMIISERWQPDPKLSVNKDVSHITSSHALITGIMQTLSLISGSSRSGITILTGLKLGFTREKAAEWSFLMAIPVIFGASMKVLLSDGGQQFVKTQFPAFLLANIISFVSGMVAIHILLKLLKTKGLYWFGWYRIGLAIGLLVLGPVLKYF